MQSAKPNWVTQIQYTNLIIRLNEEKMWVEAFHKQQQPK